MVKATDDRKKEYARLIINLGVNIQKGEPLVVKAPIEGADFVRLLAEEAYNRGASDVHINWYDDRLTRMKYDNAPMEVFEEYPQWKVDAEKYYAEKGAAFISISAVDPELLQGVDPKKIATFNKAAAIANKDNMKYTMNDLNSWCVLSIPTTGWAKKLFPDLDDEKAVERLWEAIYEAVFVNIVVSKSYKNHDDISSMNSIDSSFSGFSQTLSSRFQLRMFRDHLFGFFSLAAS
jgi:aminopeptidase